MTTEARARSIEWARSIIANPRVVFLDTETTGKEHDAEICDIGIVGIDGWVWIDQLIKPSIPIPDDAAAIHGITNEMVADAPSWEWIGRSVAAVLRDAPVVIYNAGYDVPIINNANQRAGIASAIRADCAMLEFARFMGVPGWKGDFKWHRLEVACAEFGIPPGGHRALADAEACRQVVLAMAAADGSADGDRFEQAALLPSGDAGERFRS